MPYIKLFGRWKHFLNDVPASAGQIVKIKLKTVGEDSNDFDSEAIYLAEEIPIVLIEGGYLPDTDRGSLQDTLIWCNAGGSTGSIYEFTDPDGKKWEASVAYGDGSPLNITEIRAGGDAPENPDTVLNLINSKIAEKAVRYDVEQSLTTDEKNQAKENLGITEGSETVSTLGSLINSATAKSTSVNADMFALMDSAASNVLKKFSWANLKATLKTYFDSLYQTLLVSGTNIKTVNGESVLGAGDLEISGGDVSSPLTLTASDETETPLTIEEADDQTSPSFVVKNSDGEESFKIEPHSYNKGIRMRGGYGENGVVLNENGLSLTDTGYGKIFSVQTNPSNAGPYFSTNQSRFTFDKDVRISYATGVGSPGDYGLVLQSPDGSLWRITVTDAGTLEVNEV